MNTKYPNILRRYLASVIDLIIAFCIMLFVRKILSSTGGISNEHMIWVSVLTFTMYEPILTSTSATIGQLIFRIRVRKLDKESKVDFPEALGRYFIKYLLGWISLMTIPARIDRRAMHDIAMDTIIVDSNKSQTT